MASTAAFAGEPVQLRENADAAEIRDSLLRLFQWLEVNDYKGYDTFDGLSSWIRPLTLKTRLLETVLQQGVRRFPINLRPILGIPKAQSSKGMGFLARGFIRLHRTTGEQHWADKAQSALNWLTEHRASGYSGACWGNHFDYVSRAFYLPKGTPTVVWTALIGHAFLDAYVHFKDDRHLETAISACKHVLNDLQQISDGRGTCISYIPVESVRVHNANVLGGSLLARTWSFTRDETLRAPAERAMQYTAQYQRPDGSWYYGEQANMHWVDNFHTAYVLDCFKYYGESTGDRQFDAALTSGYQYWKKTFFLPDGTPRYYNHKTLPVDIQCCSQAIDTLTFFSDRDPEAVPLALKVARYTIAQMQDKSGYFYYRRYSPRLVNKTPTLHWGQATMFSALSALLQRVAVLGASA